MNTLTTDFTGTYDWPAEEAIEVCRYFQSMIDSDYTLSELLPMVDRERKHWLKVFGENEQGRADMRRFCEVFNADIGSKLKVTL